jgi:high-affinity Fe2+/Pb2+ permease
LISWAPRLPSLGIYPTFESMLAQCLLLTLLAAALLWTFVIAPQRMQNAVGAVNP